MTNIFKDSRRDLRERAFQTLFALEFGGEALEQALFAYTYDKPIDEETEVDVPAFLLSLVTGVREELAQLDSQIEEKLKESWSLSRFFYKCNKKKVASGDFLRLSFIYCHQQSDSLEVHNHD